MENLELIDEVLNTQKVVFTEDILNEIHKEIQEFNLQSIAIFCDEAGSLFATEITDNLRKEYKINSVVVSSKNCYSMRGINQAIAGLWENSRVIIAVGSNAILNLSKLVGGTYNLKTILIPCEYVNTKICQQKAYIDDDFMPHFYGSSSEISCIVSMHNIINSNNLADVFGECVATSWQFFEGFIKNKFLNINEKISNVLEIIKNIISLEPYLENKNENQIKIFLKLICLLSIKLGEENVIDEAFLSACIMKKTQNLDISISKLYFLNTQVLCAMFTVYFNNNLESPLLVNVTSLNKDLFLKNKTIKATINLNNYLKDEDFSQSTVYQKILYIYKIYSSEINTLCSRFQSFYEKCNLLFKKLHTDAGYSLFQKLKFEDFENACINLGLFYEDSILNKLHLLKVV